MRRRAFISGVAAVLSAPLAAEAQPKVPRIGVLEANPLGGAGDAFRDGLRQFGYVEGKNIAIEWRWVRARSERFLE
jgi:putative ABC transport system substrate-binding protein